MARHQEYIRKRLASGLCRRCGKNSSIENRTYCADCGSKNALKTVLWRLRYKILVLGFYSKNKYVCACCKEADVRFLQIEHINGDGAEHRLRLGHNKKGMCASHQVYKWLVDQNYPSGYEVLCGSCNSARHIYGVCPHKCRKIIAKDILNKTSIEIYKMMKGIA